jgi:hypothetical protein
VVKAVALAASVATVAFGCAAPRIREPQYGAQTLPEAGWVNELDDAPPPVEVEEVTQPPGEAFVWVDGQWIWQPGTRRWTWEQGQWCVPPPGAVYYARPGIKRYRTFEGRVKRWNGALQRFEEVDSGDDHYRWTRGRFYGREADGTLVPSRQTPVCEPGKTLEKSTTSP